MMTLDDYQTKAGVYQLDVPPTERIFGLLEEAGEVAAIFKRLQRGDYGLMFDPGPKLAKELGDILWYVSRIAADNNWKLSDIANSNLEKLESRAIRGKILGEGSDR